MFLTILIFILILGILVFVHEFGHFVSARKMGVKVEEFGLGLPPRLFGIKKGETIYSLNLLPLGGFCKIKGESGECVEDKDSFAHKKIWQRFIILTSGIAMNFLLAIFLLSIGFLIGLPQVLDDLPQGAKISDPKIQLISILKESPAEKAGLRIGDTILSIDDQEFKEIKETQEYIAKKSGQTLRIKLKRGKDIFEREIIPDFSIKDKETEEEKRGIIGVGLVKTGIVSYSWYKSFWYGLVITFSLVAQIILAIGLLIRDLILRQPLSIDVAGPVGIAVITGQVVQLGFIYILQFTALLSINLATINFFPFPALDGGRVIALGIEKIRRKPNNPKIENFIHNIGFVFLLTLIILITFRDISRLGEKISELIGRLF